MSDLYLRPLSHSEQSELTFPDEPLGNHEYDPFAIWQTALSFCSTSRAEPLRPFQPNEHEQPHLSTAGHPNAKALSRLEAELLAFCHELRFENGTKPT